MFTSAVQVLWIARYDYQPDWQLLKHEHEYFQMICFLSGSGQFTLGKADYSVTPGSLFLIKPRYLHGLVPMSLVKTLDVKFLVTDRSLHQLLLTSGDRVQDKDLAAAGLFEHIRREGEEAGPLHRELCDAYLIQILIHFLRLDKQASGESSADVEQEPVPDPAGGVPGQRLSRLTTTPSWLLRAITTTASSEPGFSSRCGTYGGTKM